MPRRSKPGLPLSGEALIRVAARFRALSDPSRLKLIATLMGGELTVNELAELTGLSQTNVSRHLGLLRREGLVAREAEGNRARYSIADPTLARVCEIVCKGLARQLEDELEALDQGAGI